jgi:hypothetical protein
MSTQAARLLSALEAEIAKLSKMEHELARTKAVLREQVTRLRVGGNPELVLATVRQSVPHETTLALLEKVDPVLGDSANGVPREKVG